MLSATGLPIWITELDIKEEDENKRADIFENILRAVFSHPAVHGVILWTFWDKHSWRGNHTSLFDGENFTVSVSLNSLNAKVTTIKNQQIDLLCKSTDRFLYDGNFDV